MRRMFSVLIAFFLLAIPAQLFAKGPTLKIIIRGGDLKAPIEIRDSAVLASFPVWAGPGTSPNEMNAFIIDWSRGPVTERPKELPRYEISFYAKHPEERLVYVVFYEYDPATQRGYVYLPGRTDQWYRLNVGTIFRGVEGNWFPAWSVWDKVARPLIAGAKPQILAASLRALIGPTRPVAAAPEDDHPMDQVKQEFGKPNPNAPAELSRFAFLIGNWRFEARVKVAGGEWQTLQGTWLGRFILDGYAIADEYRMTDSSGKLIVLGINLRTHDATKKTWNMKWLNALTGTWVDLGPEELGGVSFDGRSIIYILKEPVADAQRLRAMGFQDAGTAHAYTRATYTNISEKHFTWRGEKSDDQKTWSEFMVVEVYRNKE